MEEAGGPGPNYFSKDNVNLDNDGTTLVLQLSKNAAGQWTCAELYSVEHTSYGEHKYYISGRPDLNHPYLVFGTFLFRYYDNNPSNDNVREIDIEFSKFGDNAATNNGGFAMHKNDGGTPYWEHKFNANLDNTGDLTTTYYNWTNNSVDFRAHKGIDGDLISGATYTPDSNSSSYFPYETDYLNMHINYWLFGGYTNSDLVSTAPVIKITNVLYPPVHYDANYNFDKDKTIKLREAICNSTINSGRNIAFEISQSIELGPGFEVKAGGTLSINASNNPQMVKRNHNPIGNNTIEPIVPEPPQENAVLYQNYPNPSTLKKSINIRLSVK